VGQLPYFAGFLVVAFPLGLAGCLALLRWRQIRGISRRHTADRVLAVGAALLGAAIALGGVEAYFLAGYLEEHSRFSFRYSVELQPVGMGTARILVPIPSDEGLSQLIALENATGGITTVNNDRVLEVFLEGRALATAMEVTDRSAVDRAVQQAVEAFGTIDVLVNNAGIVSLEPFLKLTDADFLRMLDVNLLGAVRCCQAVGPLMIEKKRGKIINISSIGGIIGRTYGEVAYAAAKAGLLGFTRCLAVEWARHNICVNAVCPGIFRTEMNDHAFQDAELRQQVERRIAFRRLGTPQELAPTVLFLASAASDFMTGATIVVDGGETVK